MASVVVVGGGLAGLVCGWRLARSGHDVELIEAEASVGGRLRRIETEHGMLEPSVGEIGWVDANLRAVIAALDLESALVPEPKRTHGLVLGGRLHRPPPIRLPELLWPGLAPRMDRPIDAVYRRPPRWSDRSVLLRALFDSIRQPSETTSRALRSLDPVAWSRASIRSFGTRWCTTRLAPALLSQTGVDLARESASVVVPILSRLIASEGRPVALEGGPTRLVEALAAPLRLRAGCRVEAVEPGSEGVRVRYRAGAREGVVLAEAAVLAIPPSGILATCPKLSPIERGHFESMEARRAIVVYRQVSREAWLLRGLAGVTFVPGELPGIRDLRVLGETPAPHSDEPFWVRTAFEEESVADHWEATDRALIQRVNAAFSRSPLGPLPDGPSRVERIDELVAVQQRGALLRRDRFQGRAERSPRIAFATEALTTPDLEGRVTAGMHAARDLAEQLALERPGDSGRA